ncbi:hypothetical protein [Blastococcus sp. KM273129]|uniref:hypothetical protein n=1 Tax=Blastococcus sp. KM273129 TaxID=2570315 RepID=UPI001F46B890|nr:hypothetical protein [Blastococcus sp. KM273129]MCF6734322.1 hypothetical protein [Blastococcus sp. KM273129]
MSTGSGSPQASGPRRRRDTDPLQMTEHEKRVAEWEARHDVAARGHRAAPDVLQHYLARERLTRAERPGHRERSAPSERSQRPAGTDGHGEGPRPAPRTGTRGWWRRLFSRSG